MDACYLPGGEKRGFPYLLPASLSKGIGTGSKLPGWTNDGLKLPTAPILAPRLAALSVEESSSESESLLESSSEAESTLAAETLSREESLSLRTFKDLPSTSTIPAKRPTKATNTTNFIFLASLHTTTRNNYFDRRTWDLILLNNCVLRILFISVK
eukprot:scpid96237/ scgid16183/ 